MEFRIQRRGPVARVTADTSVRAMVDAWRGDPDGWIDLLCACPRPAVFWETPVLTDDRWDDRFECVLVDADGLARCTADPQAFREHFDGPVATFPNLGRSAVLVAPAPAPAVDGTHLLSFLRTAERDRARALWAAVADAVDARVGDVPVWVSTAGMGVSWLHVRLDDRPKYYRFRPYRNGH